MGKDSAFSHVQGEKPGMVDIGDKKVSERKAIAKALIKIPASLGEKLRDCALVNTKGPVFHTAIVAGTMAAKNTAQIIPFCHSLFLSQVKIDIVLLNNETIEIISLVKTSSKTGVEMEALMAASVASMTIYDMCKSHSSALVVQEIKLVEKTGGKSDYYA